MPPLAAATTGRLLPQMARGGSPRRTGPVRTPTSSGRPTKPPLHCGSPAWTSCSARSATCRGRRGGEFRRTGNSPSFPHRGSEPRFQLRRAGAGRGDPRQAARVQPAAGRGGALGARLVPARAETDPCRGPRPPVERRPVRGTGPRAVQQCAVRDRAASRPHGSRAAFHGFHRTAGPGMSAS
jgi:hypothetical protein